MAACYGRKYDHCSSASDLICIYTEVVYQWNRWRYRYEGVSPFYIDIGSVKRVDAFDAFVKM